YTENGPAGLLEDRRVVVIATRGGKYAGTPGDSQTPLIRSFFGLLGLKSLEFVYAEGLTMGPEAAEQARAGALEQLQILAASDADRGAA
ncbi:MAG: NAD(P)H-dependent oxidoreductase, partial [Pseudomonadota bacterium]